MKAAETMAEYLTSALPELKVGLIHGKMKTAARDVVMREFENGEVNVLVSTTVIEVGVNVPNASLMIVENAERFGLSQASAQGKSRARKYKVLLHPCFGRKGFGGKRKARSDKEHDRRIQNSRIRP